MTKLKNIDKLRYVLPVDSLVVFWGSYQRNINNGYVQYAIEYETAYYECLIPELYVYYIHSKGASNKYVCISRASYKLGDHLLKKLVPNSCFWGTIDKPKEC